MKFNSFNYIRPVMDELKASFEGLLERFEKASSVEEQSLIMDAINRLRSEYESMSEIASIRYTMDTANEEYEKEKDFFDDSTPIYKEYISRYYSLLSASKFRGQLEAKWGKQLFNIAELTVKTFSPEIIEDLQQENRLKSEYVKLIASVKIMFEGEERNFYGMLPFQMSLDREVRKSAYKARYDYMHSIQPQLDDIYDKLVKVRTQIAHKLGYKNYIELGYARMLRSDYNAEMVAAFRKQIQEFLVPIVSKLKDSQRERLSLSELKFHDELLKFESGNPVPKGDPQWIIERAKDMYSEMSEETGEFFRFMVENELMDLITRKGKAAGGYCTYISKHSSPFIFSNFNGTSDDIDVLTHEAGHAFQAYSSRSFKIPEYYWPTLEACEIHSMGMEFLAWPWMSSFFKEDTDKYKYLHLSDALIFIPYAATVDEYQHIVYENPDMTPTERRKAWRALEKKYYPHRDYNGHEYLENGGLWQQQGHIYEDPFYYIDYALAQICALQLWKMSNQDKAKTWDIYMKLCKMGGSKSFVELVKEAGLILPFDEGCVESVVGEIKQWLDKIDDNKL